MKKSKPEKNKIKYSFLSSGLPNVSPADAYKLCSEGAVILDIRKQYMTSFKRFGVPEVLYYPGAKRLEITNPDLNRTYIVAETSTGCNSREIVRDMIRSGFTNVYNLAGGFVEWERDGLPVETDIKNRLSGSCMCQLRPREK